MTSCFSAQPLVFPPRFHRRGSPASPPRKFRRILCSSLSSFTGESNAAPAPSDLVSTKKTKGQRWSQTFCDILDDAVDRHFTRYPLHPSVDPALLLVGNFAPVDELPPTPCPIVRGSIPECLRGGAYIRNGPNPRQHPRGPYHLFDGDGMLHSLLLPGGGADASHAVLCSRYSRTSSPVVSRSFSLRGVHGIARLVLGMLRFLAEQMNRTEGMGPANTSVSFFWNNIFVLGETDQPFTVYLSPEDGDLLSTERRELGGKLVKGGSVHHKQDPVTGELFAVNYSLLEVPIASVLQPSIFHDFAVTKHYAIFPETQLVMDPLGMAFCDGSFIRCDTRKTSRVGVLSRYAASGSEITWFDVPGFNPLHICNAWEEGDDGGVVVLVGSSSVNLQHFVERMELGHGHIEMVRIDLKTRIVTRTLLSVMSLGFGGVNPAYQGRKSRYAYAAISDFPPKIQGVAKLDLEVAAQRRDCVVVRREFGPGCFCGESFFVPKGEGKDLDEDDGYLLTFVQDENEEKSKFVVMDAKSPELEVIAEVELPRRVPYGFHGVFVSQSDLKRQQKR
ncbi:unnamed protein product [Spirodela intermedia]|uniref:Uncharacterized protein n=1 Tax=Spirodela intermedia TaxID=51605 RepID=A0A7I8IUA7_SPIIN|nr:unnamed protein product [Spirodela intermedia]CAA6660547.1 unnamed protein product [Spirodela intermedia]